METLLIVLGAWFVMTAFFVFAKWTLWEVFNIQVSFALLFEPRDVWVGFYWDDKKNWLYFLPIPCYGLIIKIGRDS